MADQFNQENFDLTKFFLVITLSIVSGCSVLLKTSDTDMKNTHYTLSPPSDVWKERGVIEEDVSAIQYLKN